MPSVVAIHDSGGFAPRWKEAALSRGHEVREVNGYDSEIMERLHGCTAFLWHLNQDDLADLDFARSILLAAEVAGLRVFPNHATSSHFDDKIAQKYLLEAIGAPLAPTWVLFSRSEALDFLSAAEYPLVFKLRRGAGSMNVRLVRNRREGVALVRRMFAGGLSPFPTGEGVRRAAKRAVGSRTGKDSVRVRLSRVIRRLVQQAIGAHRERGYALFQRFIAGNDHDIRATVIGGRCFVFRRGVRPNDFRASGSGRISYFAEAQLPRDAAEMAFSISQRLGFQSMAYDFVRDPGDGRLILLEISYVFNAQAVANCPGHLDRSGVWHPGSVWPQDAIVEDLLS